MNFLSGLSTLFKPIVTAEYITFVAALCLLPRRVGVWRLFILLMLATIATETAGWWMSRHEQNNNWIFNLLMLVSNVFWISVFRWAEPMEKAGRLLWGLLAGFVCFGLVNLVFFQGFWLYNWYTDALGEVIMAAICCYFFLVCLKAEEYRDLFRYEYFWLANGLLFYSLGSVVLYIFFDALVRYYKHTRIDIYGFINSGLNIILYGSLIIAFICRNRNTRSSPGS